MNDETAKARWNLPTPYESCAGDAKPKASSRHGERSPQTQHFSSLCMREKQERKHNAQERSGAGKNDQPGETKLFDQETCDSPGTESPVAARTKRMVSPGIYVIVIRPTMSADRADKADGVPQGGLVRMENGAPGKFAHLTASLATAGASVLWRRGLELALEKIRIPGQQRRLIGHSLTILFERALAFDQKSELIVTDGSVHAALSARF
jgi:hypothetical protein